MLPTVLADVLASGFGLAEAPTLEPGGALLFSDVLGGGVHRLEGGSATTLVPKRRGVGGIALHADGGVVVSGRAIVHVCNGESRTILDVDGVAGWNDLCTDSAGRVYAGALRFAVFDPSATPVPGELWRIDTDGTATVLYGDVIHANGVGLSPDERTIYHSDSRANQIIVHDLTEDGTATRRRAIDTAPYGQSRRPRRRRTRVYLGRHHRPRRPSLLHSRWGIGHHPRSPLDARDQPVLRG
jgi:sugar lactone lactonase YvrE